MPQKRTVNVLLLSFGFMLLFVSFQTMSNILDTIISSVHKDNPDYNADAMIGLFIVYITLAVSNFIAPPIIKLLGPRICMIIGALTYTAYIGSFMVPKAWVLYAVSGLLGFGAALIWTAQGKYLTDNSDNLTIARNAGMFWGIFQCSQFIGNLYVFFAFGKSGGSEKEFIAEATRKNIYITLSAMSAAGVVFLFLLRRAATADGQPVQSTQTGSGILSAIKLFGHGRILLLSITFWFTGALLSFAGSVYGNCIGYTLKIADNPKPLVGLSGVFLALGEVVGGTLFGILGPKTVKWGRNPIIILGFLILTVAFGMIFVNIPNSAPLGNTDDVSILPKPVKNLALGCSFLLGLGDSCFNTQIYSILGTLYHEDSAPAFAVFKLIQSVATGVGFIYTKGLGLRMLLYILMGLLVLSIPTFMIVERIAAKVQRQLSGLESSPSPSTSSTESKED